MTSDLEIVMSTNTRIRWHGLVGRLSRWLAAILVVAGAAAWARENNHMDDTAAKARARLAKIVAIEDDNEFLAACMTLLHEFGLDITLVFGDRHLIGGGFTLMTEKSGGAEWVLLDEEEREVRLPKGRFVKFLHAGKIQDAAPEPTPLDGVTFICVDDTATFVSMKTGRVRRWPMSAE